MNNDKMSAAEDNKYYAEGSEWKEVRATEAGTPAKVTIDTPMLRNLLGDLWHRGSDNNADTDGLEAVIIRHIDAALDARAEEARREARKQAEEYLASVHVEGLKNNEHYRERMFIEIVRADEAAGMKRFTRVAAQRTAGGEAVAELVAAARSFIQYADDVSEDGVESDALREAIKKFDSGPVAEAAAQACPDPKACDAQGCVNPRGRCEEAAAQADDFTLVDVANACTEANIGDEDFARISAALLAAAPTAQPTPNKNAPALAGRGVGELARVRTGSDASLAQPTLPDDERAALSDEEILTLSEEYYAGRNMQGRRMFSDRKLVEFVRAALRQPGALPDAELRLKAVYEAIGKVVAGEKELNLTRLHDWLGGERGLSIDAVLEDASGALPDDAQMAADWEIVEQYMGDVWPNDRPAWDRIRPRLLAALRQSGALGDEQLRADEEGRAAFEAQYRALHAAGKLASLNLDRISGHDGYSDEYINLCWRGWQMVSADISRLSAAAAKCK